MSLINQVLQDLDRRHANGGDVPSAVKALPVATGGGRYWRVVAISAVAVVVVGAGAGVAAWSMGARAQAAPAHAAAAVATTLPTPVVMAPPPASAPAAAIDARQDRPADSAAVHAGEKAAQAVASKRPAQAATAAATPKPSASGPASQALVAAAPQTLVAAAPMPVAAAAALNTPAIASEPRIEKRAPNRTANERAEASYNMGVAAHQHGQLAEAAAAYAAALREEASFASARQALAGVMISQGRADDAKSLLSEGIALAPEHTGLAMALAHLHAERGELQRAAEVLQPSDLASMSAEDHAFRGAVLQRLNRHAEASEHFAAALRTAPGNGVWWMGLGMSQAAEGRNENAKEAFNRARSSGSLSAELAQYVEQRLRQLL